MKICIEHSAALTLDFHDHLGEYDLFVVQHPDNQYTILRNAYGDTMGPVDAKMLIFIFTQILTPS
jgi:hypothetical protein